MESSPEPIDARSNHKDNQLHKHSFHITSIQAALNEITSAPRANLSK